MMMAEEAQRDVPLSEPPPAAAESIPESPKLPISTTDSSLSSSSSSPTSPADSHSHSSSSSSSSEEDNISKDEETDDEEKPIKKPQTLIHPAIHLPKPEAPHGLLRKSRSTGSEDSHHPLERCASTTSSTDSFSTVGKFFRERSSSLSSTITKHLSSVFTDVADASNVTEFHLSGLKVIVNLKDSTDDVSDNHHDDQIHHIRGRISFFSRSNCRDSTAVRTFFRQRGLPYVEINVDVFPEREKELVERTGGSSVPQIFFNEKLVGGLVVLNSLRNSGEFNRRLKEMVGRRCPESAPRVPVYGFDDDDDDGVMRRVKVDGLVGVVRVLRQKLPIQDRLMKMKIVKNCFAGSEMVEALIHHLDCGRKKAVEIGKELARKHFIHHVFRKNDFEDGNNLFYRFLEHDPTVPQCFNLRGTTNDDEPKPASVVGKRLTTLMSAILEAYASDDKQHLDYSRIAASEEFRRYVNVVQDLQRVDIFTLSVDETIAFFLNLYNAMVIHAIIRIGKPGVIDQRGFFGDFYYIVGGYPYSLSTIKNGILRSNRRQPYSFIKPFSAGDKRLDLALPKMNPLIHFGLCNGARSSPTVRFFPAQGVEVELRYAAREFFIDGGIEFDLSKRTVYLTRIIKWYSMDFGQDREILNWILNYLNATKAGLLTHLLKDGGPINIAYQNFDWSLNF